MIVDRVYTPGLAQVAYLVADETAGEAAVIDPRRDVDVYLDWVAERGLRLVAVAETHVHADFVSGARELAAATGAPVFAGALGQTEFPHVPLADGEEIAVGRLRLRAHWTPGHTPEHIAYLLFDPERGRDPVALFSGDVLFAGEIGRPDLLGPEAQQALIEQLYDTVEHRLKSLPDVTIVYPGHTAGSPCGKKIGDAPQTTIGQERVVNYAFNQPDKATFIAAVMAGMPEPPAYYPRMKQVNKVGPILLRELPTGGPMSPAEIAAAHESGALVIDTRPPDRFAAGHLPGSVAVGLGPNFAIWAGWLTPYDRDVVLVLADDADYEQARTELRRVGVDRVAGWLAGGVDAWEAAGNRLTPLVTVSPSDLAARGGDGEAIAVLDVRDPTEWSAGAAPGSLNLPAGEIAQGRRPPVDGATVAVMCSTGYRSTLTASLLQARGIANVVNVAGGFEAWRSAGLPTTAEAAVPA